MALHRRLVLLGNQIRSRVMPMSADCGTELALNISGFEASSGLLSVLAGCEVR
jgi:hypothetical protein